LPSSAKKNAAGVLSFSEGDADHIMSIALSDNTAGRADYCRSKKRRKRKKRISA